MVLRAHAQNQLNPRAPRAGETLYGFLTASDYRFEVDLGNFVTNHDDLCYIEVENVTPIVATYGQGITNLAPTTGYASSGNSDNSNALNSVFNVMGAIEIRADIPQYHSWDTDSRTQTTSLAILERDTSYFQTTAYNFVDALAAFADPRQNQTFRLAHRPERIVVRPEVLQKKFWVLSLNVRGIHELPAAVTTIENPSTGVPLGNMFAAVQGFDIVLAITK